MDDPRAGPLYSVDGGAGVLLSIGLMQALDLDAMQDCITTSHGSAGDHVFTFCLWQQGYGHAPCILSATSPRTPGLHPPIPSCPPNLQACLLPHRSFPSS